MFANIQVGLLAKACCPRPNVPTVWFALPLGDAGELATEGRKLPAEPNIQNIGAL